MYTKEILKFVFQQVNKIRNCALSEPFSFTKQKADEFELRKFLPCTDRLVGGIRVLVRL